MGQLADAGYDNDGVDISVDVSAGAIVGVGVNGHSVSLDVSLGVVSLTVAFPPLTSLDS